MANVLAGSALRLSAFSKVAFVLVTTSIGVDETDNRVTVEAQREHDAAGWVMPALAPVFPGGEAYDLVKRVYTCGADLTRRCEVGSWHGWTPPP